MFMAFNSSVNSKNLSKQEEAEIRRDQQIIATGANDAPKSGGGLYWAEVDEITGEVKDHEDGKDYTREGDSNKRAQAEIIQEIARKLVDKGLANEQKEPEIHKVLKESKDRKSVV